MGEAGCDDAASGSLGQPVCTLKRALELIPAAPGIVTLLDGTYRGGATVNRRGSAAEYFVIRAAPGAKPVVLGSSAISGASFEAVGGGLMRAAVSALEKDPAGLWLADGTRMTHVMEMRSGVRSHAPSSAVVEAGTWTKADADGNGCGDDNAACFIYLRPPAGLDVAAASFEASQHGFVYSNGGDFLVIDGISTRFTQSAAVFTESATNLLIQNCDFAHNANSNDNSYNLRLWGSDGSIVRNNKVSDSRYWGGAVNSHGITFMVAGNHQDIWVCENEIFDGVGTGVSTKDGSSNIHVVGNYIHDMGSGVRTSDHRCDWRGCDTEDFGGGGYDIRENLFVRCGDGVKVDDRALERPSAERQVSLSRIYNNLFVDTERGVSVQRVATQPFLRNNLFLSGNAGIYFSAGGQTTWPDYYLGQGFNSDFNFFALETAVYVYANWSGTERGLSLAEYQAEFAGDPGSLGGQPDLQADYRPQAGSPVVGAGDPSVFPGQSQVNIGLYPLLTP